MTVYIVEGNGYECSVILGVFSTAELAATHADKARLLGEYQRVEVNQVEVDEDIGDEVFTEYTATINLYDGAVSVNSRKLLGKRRNAEVGVNAQDVYKSGRKSMMKYYHVIAISDKSELDAQRSAAEAVQTWIKDNPDIVQAMAEYKSEAERLASRVDELNERFESATAEERREIIQEMRMALRDKQAHESA